MKLFRRAEAGQSVPIAGLLMAVTFAALAMVVGLGERATELTKAQTAADAAALAGASQGPVAANNVALANGADTVNVQTIGSRIIVTVEVNGVERIASAEATRQTEGLSPAMLATIATIEDRLGYEIPIASGYRSYASQVALWQNRATNPYPVAPPGTSNHELGLAIDVPSWFAPTLAEIGPASGLCQPLPVSDPVHFELCRRK